MKYFLSLVAAVVVLFTTAAAVSPDGLEQILRDHERRIATQEELGRHNEKQLFDLDGWYDNRINKLEKHYDSKIAEHEQTDTELESLLEFLKSAGTFGIGVLSLVFGYIGIRNVIRKD
ncbi:MAG: hypothetical protein WCP79_13195 [Bacillota bacterium]